VGLGVSLALLPLLGSRLYSGFELKTVDARMRLRGAAAAAPEVVVCAIDAASIDRLGQWPWPRGVLAELVRRLAAAGARTIAFDIVFSEPDRAGLEQDKALARALEEAAGRAVLGFYVGLDEVLASGAASTPLPAAVETAVTPPGGFPELRTWPAIESNVAPLAAAAPAAGHFVFLPDSDGTVRHYPLIVDHAGSLYPALALRAVSVFLGGAPISVRPGQGALPVVDLGSRPIPASEQGELWINFRGPFERGFAYHSAADVLEGRVPAEALRDRLVFIGATETGLGDVVTSPFDAVVPGVEVHATVADNLLHGRFIRDGAPETLLSVLALLALGPLGGSLAARSRRPLGGAAGALALVAGWGVATHLAFVVSARHLHVVLPVLAVALGYTAAAVWRIAFVEARARQIRAVFSRYVSQAVVEEMLRDPDKVRLGGEKRELTVLFSDLRGFTSSSERMEPEQVVAVLNEYMTPMTRIILDQGGTIDKYMGDAIMAFFGAPVAQPDHAARACAAALAMRRRLAGLNAGWAPRGQAPLAAGIGLNTGAMAVGNMGSEMIFDYTVVGDHVNLGSRLEGLTKLYGVEIVASEFTAAAAGADFAFRELDRVRVKGRREPVRVFELLGRADERLPAAEFLQGFAAGLAAWRAGDAGAAAAHFTTCLALAPGDGPAALYVRRLEALRAHPPGAAWDGVTELSEK